MGLVLRGPQPFSRFKLERFGEAVGLRYRYDMVRAYQLGIGPAFQEPHLVTFTWTVDGIKFRQNLHLCANASMYAVDENWGFAPDDIALLKTRVMVSMYASA